MNDAPRTVDATRAYDAIASQYDRVPAENRINAYMRRVSLDRLRATFRPGQRVLELGCGTGDEALDLAAHGVTVVGLDPSPEMVGIARAKAVSRGLPDRATFHVSASRDLSVLALPGAPFDGAYASFSLAYEADLAPVATALHERLADDAHVLASVPSRVCLVELLAAFAVGRPGLPGRRLRSWHGHKVGAYEVPIRTYTPARLARSLSPHFVLEHIEALPAIVPPPYANRLYARLGGLADGIERIDASLRTHAPFRSIGDHFLARFRHRSPRIGPEPSTRLSEP